MKLPSLLTALDKRQIRLARTAEGKLALRGSDLNLSAKMVAALRRYKRRIVRRLNGEEMTPRQLRAALAVPEYKVVASSDGLAEVVQIIKASKRVALDTETTGLDPARSRLRLVQLATDGGAVFILDLFKIDPKAQAPLFEALAAVELVVHNAAFDLAFLWRLGFRPGKVTDLLLVSRLLTAGTRAGNSLADLADRELGFALDKTHQKEDWTGKLTRAQLDYAALDAAVLLLLRDKLWLKIEEADLEKVAALESKAVPAFIWLACSGAPFDPHAWEALATEAEASAAAALQALNDEFVPHLSPANDTPPNWNSPKQVKEAFALLGIDLQSTGAEVLAAVQHPLARRLLDHRHTRQRVTAFGRKWLGFPVEGRIYAGFVQLGTGTGRTSCKAPNLQQVPKDERYRKCFVAPPGRVLVKADYNQLQLRLAAKIANESRMQRAFREGADLHTLTAQHVTGRTEVTQDERKLAKALNFGLLFGIGVRRFAEYARKDYGVELTEAQARDLRTTFFRAYPALCRWHSRVEREGAIASRTALGRRRLFDAMTPLTERLASPVQGAEADGVKKALALLWQRREECPGAFLVLFAHDEIVVECDESQGESVAEWLREAMVDGMRDILDPVPCVVEVKIAKTWGGDPAPNPAPRRQMPPALTSSASVEWYTPPEILAATTHVLGSIDLDPCSNSHTEPNVPADRHYTAADDGLSKEWAAWTLFLNPPYGREIGAWIDKLLQEYTAGRVREAIALVPARTDTAWFKRLHRRAICWIRGRLRFVGAEHNAPFPSAVVYLGPRPKRFRAKFAHLGEVSLPAGRRTTTGLR